MVENPGKRSFYYNMAAGFAKELSIAKFRQNTKTITGGWKTRAKSGVGQKIKNTPSKIGI
jgi:hypothetical protein